MKDKYLILHLLPALLPFFWLIRGVTAMKKKRQGTVRLLRQAFSISHDEAVRMKQLHKRGGL